MKKPETDQEYNELWAECMGYEHKAYGFRTRCIGEDGLYLWADPVHDMSQCWLLVEKMGGEGYLFEMHIDDIADANFYKSHEMGYAEADTPQRAIIMACAKAKGLINE